MENKNEGIHEGLNLLKSISILAVILYHVCCVFYQFGLPGWRSAVLLSSVTRFCVPVFFMITGALILRSNDGPVAFLRKKVGRVIIPILFWSAFYYFYILLIYNHDFSLNDMLKAIFIMPSSYHLWFVYAILGFYLTAPVLISVRKESVNAVCSYYLVVWSIMCLILPFSRLFTDFIPENFGTPFLSYESYQFLNYSGYFVAGHLIFSNRERIKINAWVYVSVFFTCSALLFLMVLSDSYKNSSIIQDKWEFKTPIVFIMSCVLFMAFTKLERIKNIKASNLTRKVSGMVFGVYLLHVSLIMIFQAYFSNELNTLRYKINGIILIPSMTAIIVVFSFLIVYILMKSPMKKIVQ